MNYIESLNVVQLFLSSINSKVFSFAPTALILFSKITCLILVALIALMTKLQFYERPISCSKSITFLDTYSESFTTYCWYDGLYIKRNSTQRLYFLRENEEIFKIRYLSWVYWFLILKCFLFYCPILVWEYSEKKFHSAVMYKKLCLLYLEGIGKRIYWNAMKCKVMCLIIVVFMFFASNIFLSGYFLDLGIEWINTYMEIDTMSNREGGLTYIFPRMAKCKFFTVGFSGTVESRDNSCIILLNSFIEKVFVFLWFWYLLIGSFATLSIFSDFTLFLIPELRVLLLDIQLSSKYPLLKYYARKSIGNYFLINTLLSKFSPQQLYESYEAMANKKDNIELGWPYDENGNSTSKKLIDKTNLLKKFFLSKLNSDMKKKHHDVNQVLDDVATVMEMEEYYHSNKK